MKRTFTNWYDKKMRSNPELSAETDRVQQLLKNIKTVAIVGISRNRHKDSHYVGRYLKNAGYKIIPVNPNADEILGETAYADLESIPKKVDTVNVFLPSKWIPDVAVYSIGAEYHMAATWNWQSS